MISGNEPSPTWAWGDEPVVMEVAMRLYTQFCAQEVVRSLEAEGREPGELHRTLAHRALAAAATFADVLEEARLARKSRRRRTAS